MLSLAGEFGQGQRRSRTAATPPRLATVRVFAGKPTIHQNWLPHRAGAGRQPLARPSEPPQPPAAHFENIIERRVQENSRGIFQLQQTMWDISSRTKENGYRGGRIFSKSRGKRGQRGRGPTIVAFRRGSGRAHKKEGPQGGALDSRRVVEGGKRRKLRSANRG